MKRVKLCCSVDTFKCTSIMTYAFKFYLYFLTSFIRVFSTSISEVGIPEVFPKLRYKSITLRCICNMETLENSRIFMSINIVKIGMKERYIKNNNWRLVWIVFLDGVFGWCFWMVFLDGVFTETYLEIRKVNISFELGGHSKLGKFV